MKLSPRQRQAVTLWANAQQAYSVQQWPKAQRLYSQALSIYEERKDNGAAARTVHQLYLVAQHQDNSTDMAAYAGAFLEYSRMGAGNIIKALLFVGQVERKLQRIKTARDALARCLRLSEERLLGSRDAGFPPWIENWLAYADALHEFALLERDADNDVQVEGLLALAELVRVQISETFE